MEMAAQLEGPIVDSIWEAFLISWHAKIAPLTCSDLSAADYPPPTYQEKSFADLLTVEGTFRLPELAQVDKSLKEHVGGDPQFDIDLAGEMHRMNATLTPTERETEPERVANHLSKHCR